jgi:hypothetical protein
MVADARLLRAEGVYGVDNLLKMVLRSGGRASLHSRCLALLPFCPTGRTNLR